MYVWTFRRPENCILKFQSTPHIQSRFQDTSNVTKQSPHRALGQIYENIYSFNFDMKKAKRWTYKS